MKSDNLLILQDNHIAVPPFTVLKFNDLIRDKAALDRQLSNFNAADKTSQNALQQALQRQFVAPDHALIDRLSSHLAVRSDCSLEDDSSYSFAGIFDSFLNVKKAEAAEYVKKCLTSLYAKKALEYISLNDIDINDLKMNVILQDMVVGERSGVLFTSNPHGLLNETLITVGRSTCDLVVEDKVDTTTYYYNTTDQKYYYTGSKDILSGDEIKQLIALSDNIKQILKETALDIEFTIADDKIYILQARPITSIDTSNIYIYDNSNIVESYPHITLPLTISFAKEIYSGVFKGVSKRILGSEKATQKLSNTLENMVDAKMGRLYYRIDNWYHVLKVLPFSKKIIPVWQEMLGVKHLNYHKARLEVGFFDSIRAYFNFFIALKRSPKNMRRLNDKFIAIHQQFNHTIEQNLSAGELRNLYYQISDALFSIWDLTLINDMYAFIYTGLLKRQLKRRYSENYQQKASEMISGVLNIESIKPIKSLLNLVQLFKSGDQVSYQKAFAEHIEHYGDRVVEELKLETRTFRTNPELLEKIVKDYSADSEKLAALKADLTAKKSNGASQGYFAKRALRGIKLREQSRLNRSKIFGMLRSIILKIANHFVDSGILSDRDDIFYLTLDEVFALIDKPFDVDGIIRKRKSAYAIYNDLPDYSRLILSNAHFDKRHARVNKTVYQHSDKNFMGTICSGGTVRGEAVVITSPDDMVDTSNKIIIAKMTDPGWVYILANALGIVTEKGSILSHTAIVSRELGIPAIVGVSGITDAIKSGQHVILNGDKGTVEVIK